MLLTIIMPIYLMRTAFCELFSCEHYLRRRVAGVFHYDRNSRYSFTYMEAKLACERGFGASIADRKQLFAANEGGLEMCRAGWITGAEVAYPRVHLNWNCGQNQTGIISYGVRKNLLEKWDVFCYKMDGDCAGALRSESPSLPSFEARGDVPFGNVGNFFYGTTPTEHSKSTKMFQGGQSIGSAVYNTLVMTSTSGRQGYMTYPPGPEIESSLSSNGLTRGNEGLSVINSYPDLESGSNTDGQMLSIPLSVVFQTDITKDESNTPLASAHFLSGVSSRTNMDIQSKEVTAYQQSNSSETIPAHTAQEFTEAPHVIPTPAFDILETLSEKGLVKNHEPMSSIAASFNLSSIPRNHIADVLKLESQESESREHVNESGSIGDIIAGSHEFHSTSTSPSIHSLESITMGMNLPVSMDSNSSSSLTALPTYQDAHTSSASPVNKSKEPVSFSFRLEGQKHEHQLMTMDELRTEIQRHKIGRSNEVTRSITHIDGLSLVHITTVPNVFNGSTDKHHISDYSETLQGLGNTGNLSNGPAPSLNQSFAGGNATWNASSLTVERLLEEDMQPNEPSPYHTQTSTLSGKDTPLQFNKTQQETLILHHTILVNEDLISTTVSPLKNSETHTPAATLPITESHSKGKVNTTETTDSDWLFNQFTVKYSGNAPQTATSQFQHNDSLMTTNVVMASTGTTPDLNFTTWFPETFEATTTISCGSLLVEENGELQSPGFPHAYPSEMDCIWMIFVQQGQLIQLNFLSMVLEEHRGCQYDYIIVFDGRMSEKQEIGRFCGSELPPPLRSSSNIMTVQMKSDASVELDGFSAHFHAVRSPVDAVITGGVRLIGGWNQFGGCVEVDIEGAQGAVCATHWGNSEAKVVCHQLGFMGNAVATSMPKSVDDPPVSVLSVKCQGHELSLDQCEVKRGEVCSTADRAAVHCQVAESCSALSNSGVLESGTYIIDPDGPSKEQNPFPVYCDMDSQPGTGVTVVRHNSESRIRVGPCEEPGCYSREVVYQNASLHQVRALIQASLSCSQKVKVECRHIRFLGEQWGWWTSWDGQKVDSWGGATTGSGRCACGERGDCDLDLSTCNCDANDEVWRSDEGFLSDMTVLPLREVRFGDTGDVPMEMAFHTVGPLQCKGQKSKEPVLVSCAALKEAGFTQSGRYLIDPDGIGHGVSQFEVYCDMTTDPLTGITVVSHDGEGRMRVPPCEEPGCYSRELQYEANLVQLHALAQASSSCQQYVKLDCRHTRFVQSGWGWWVSRTGQKRLDWGGAKSNSGSCACGITGNCDKPGLLCNCDSNDHIWRSDEGILTDRSALPVRAVHFGDTKDIPLEMAFHTIGKFACRGNGSSIP